MEAEDKQRDPRGRKSSDLNVWRFWRAQQKPWRTTVLRTSLDRLGYKMVLPYLSLYIILMGATKTQLGYVTSLGLILTALLGPLLGSIIDRNGPKGVYIFGIGVIIGCYLAFSTARVWQAAALGMLLYQIGSGVSGSSCSSICGNCLASCDRAKGMQICEALFAGTLGVIGPSLSGWILVHVMGVEGTPTDPESIRPLFYLSMGIAILSLLVVVFRLDNVKWGVKTGTRHNVFRDAAAILRADRNCVKCLFCAAVSSMPAAMVIPYVQLFAAEYKAAGAGTLAAITSATAVSNVLCGYFLGVLSDRYGRKKILLTTIALYVAGLVVLMTAPRAAVLPMVLVGLLSGFQEIGLTLSGSLQNELVPRSVMGRWHGVIRLFSSLWSALMAAVAGVIYEKLGGQWVFILYIACELLVRAPLLLSMPETLHYQVDESRFAALND